MGRAKARDPQKMPSQYWAYGFYAVLGALLLGAVLLMTVARLEWLSALADVPPARELSLVSERGAAFQGRLEGRAATTPLGLPAVAWIGTVEVTRRRAKSSVSSEKCRIGATEGLSLVTSAGRIPIVAPNLSSIDVDRSGTRALPRGRIWWLRDHRTVSPLPASVIAACSLRADDLARDQWVYAEDRATAGDEMGFAGCPRDGALDACATGPSAGHLTASVPSLIVKLADGTLSMMALLAGLLTFFTLVMGLGALRALRRAAWPGGSS